DGFRSSTSVSSVVVGDECRKACGRWYDQLTRKPAEPQHQTGAWTRCAIEAADCAHDDAGALGCGLHGDVRRSVAQIGDEMHALIGPNNADPLRDASASAPVRCVARDRAPACDECAQRNGLVA